jgi:O-antigen/teichoic acid export membrane protein
LVALNNESALKILYRQSSQLIAVIVLSFAFVTSLFSPEIILLWTRNQKTTRMAAPIVSILVIGIALNGLISMPYAMHLAHGWTNLGFRITLVLIITLVPAIIL